MMRKVLIHHVDDIGDVEDFANELKTGDVVKLKLTAGLWEKPFKEALGQKVWKEKQQKFRSHGKKLWNEDCLETTGAQNLGKPENM